MMFLPIILIFLASSYAKLEVRLTSIHFPLLSQNKIIAVNTTCNATNMNVTLMMEKPFKGLLSTKDFSKECRTVGILKNIISILVPTSGCGVRMSANSSDGSLFYSLTLVAQQDKFLRQITDQEKTVQCRLRDGALSLKSEPMFEALKTEVNQADEKEYRTGRMRAGWKGIQTDYKPENDDVLDKEVEDILGAARAWMEISSIENHTKNERVQVGEPTLLSVKSTLPAGIGWRVVDCTAHDGIGEVSQRLLDEIGCPIDDTILPALIVTEPKMMGKHGDAVKMMRHQEAVTSFPAFKFPDRDRLHVSCGLQLCRGKCEVVDCRGLNDTAIRGPRKLDKGEQGEILDRLEVFNSVEVLAPGIELDDLRNPEISTDGNLIGQS